MIPKVGDKMTFEELVERFNFLLENHPEFRDKEVEFLVDVGGDEAYYSFNELGDVYIDDGGVVNIDINRRNK